MAYTPKFLTAEDYPEIRDQLGGISEDQIADDDIEKSSYLQRAEAEIAADVPTWNSEDSDEDRLALRKLHLKVAAICLTACYLVPKIQELNKSEQINGDYAYVNLTVQEWSQKAQALAASAAGAISRAIATIPTAEPEASLLAFRVAGPSRGRCD